MALFRQDLIPRLEDTGIRLLAFQDGGKNWNCLQHQPPVFLVLCQLYQYICKEQKRDCCSSCINLVIWWKWLVPYFKSSSLQGMWGENLQREKKKILITAVTDRLHVYGSPLCISNVSLFFWIVVELILRCFFSCLSYQRKVTSPISHETYFPLKSFRDSSSCAEWWILWWCLSWSPSTLTSLTSGRSLYSPWLYPNPKHHHTHKLYCEGSTIHRCAGITCENLTFNPTFLITYFHPNLDCHGFNAQSNVNIL